MRHLEARIDELAALMDEFGLEEASWKTEDGQVTFRRRPLRKSNDAAQSDFADQLESESPRILTPVPEPIPVGLPVSSPMPGIYYSAPSPGTPPFVKVGESVVAGQVIGLIEAMKVFNEIPSPLSGTVLSIHVAGGDLVGPGDVIMRIG